MELHGLARKKSVWGYRLLLFYVVGVSCLLEKKRLVGLQKIESGEQGRERRGEYIPFLAYSSTSSACS